MTTSTLRIRPMRLEDIDQVHLIDTISFSLPWPKSSYRFELLNNQASMAWVAEIERQNGSAEVIGMIVVWLIIDEAHIATLAVHPDYRGRGIGRQLMVIALREASQRGMRIATLEVRARNQLAQSLYYRLGFRETGRRLRYYKDNQEDALILSIEFNDEIRSRLMSDQENIQEVECEC